MKLDKQNNRRQFLKNTSLAALSLGILPNTTKGQQDQHKNASECEPTTLDSYGQGPFYTENPPTIEANQLASEAETGKRIIISGRIFNLNCGEYIPNTVVDIWHANDAGQYDNQGFNLRGKTISNEQGFYVFETIKPGKYLNGNQYRPAHIHFKITPPDFDTLTTQLYFEGDTDIPADAAASANSGQFDATNRIIPLTENSDGKLEGTWDIVISGEGTALGLQDIHLNKGMIYQINPNPFSDKVVIKYGVFEKAKISLLVYNLNGQLVATLEERILPPNKYEAEWQASPYLPSGHYFIALKVNDLQVHYLKIVKK